MKKLILVYGILIVALILLAVVRGGDFASFLPFKSKASAEINGKKINLTLAKSEKEKVKGLSGAKNLSENQGMLFIFDKKDKYGFWMKGVNFALDIIYISDGTVIYIVENAPPVKNSQNLIIYKPDEPVNYVLELNGGSAKKLNIKKGGKIIFKNI